MRVLTYILLPMGSHYSTAGGSDGKETKTMQVSKLSKIWALQMFSVEQTAFNTSDWPQGCT